MKDAANVGALFDAPTLLNNAKVETGKVDVKLMETSLSIDVLNTRPPVWSDSSVFPQIHKGNHMGGCFMLCSDSGRENPMKVLCFAIRLISDGNEDEQNHGSGPTTR